MNFAEDGLLVGSSEAVELRHHVHHKLRNKLRKWHVKTKVGHFGETNLPF